VCTSDVLDMLLAGGRRDGAETLPDLARGEGLLPTLVTAWRRESRPVAPALVAETRAHLRRDGRYRVVERLLADRLGAVRVLKGRHVAARYPAGWLRASRDLDLEVAGPAEVAEAGGVLESAGWTPDRLTVFADAGTVQVALDLAGPPRPGPLGADLVQVQTPGWFGAGPGSPPRADCAALRGLDDTQRALLEVVAGAARKGVRARHVLDAAVLTGRDGPGAGTAEALRELGLADRLAAVQQVARAVRARCTGPAGRAPVPVPRLPVPTSPQPADPRPPGGDAEAFVCGLPLTGAVLPGSPRLPELRVSADRSGAVRFSGPMGSGRLHRRPW
jgi:hypothetical protein